ncbi:hypothetical protein BKA81DRAFT_432953 [Phyllosticta paracitricarpa]
MKNIDPALCAASTSQQSSNRPLKPTPVTLASAEKPHEHPLDWTEDLTPSWYPEYSATPPEVCYWASSPSNIHERHWVKVASTYEDPVENSIRIASILRRAESTLYEVPSNAGLKYPQYARGHSLRLMSQGPNEFRSGSKGLKELGQGCTSADIPDGAYYHGSGLYYFPAPTRLKQMMTVEDESVETPSRLSHGRNPSGFGSKRLASSQSTTQMSESDTELEMEDISLASPSAVSDSPPTSPSMPSSPPCLPANSISQDYYGPINQYSGVISDDSDGSVYSDDMDPFIELEDSDSTNLDEFCQKSLHDDDFDLGAVSCWPAVTSIRLEAANDHQHRDLVDITCDGCDHGQFGTDDPRELPVLPPGYRWTAHSFALRHSGPRLIVHAPPADDYDYDFDDNFSCFGSDGTSVYSGSPVKLIQSDKPSLWSVLIPEGDETDYTEPPKTLYEGFINEHGSTFGQRAIQQKECSFATRSFAGILQFVGLA